MWGIVGWVFGSVGTGLVFGLLAAARSLDDEEATAMNADMRRRHPTAAPEKSMTIDQYLRRYAPAERRMELHEQQEILRRARAMTDEIGTLGHLTMPDPEVDEGIIRLFPHPDPPDRWRRSIDDD